MYKRQVLRYLFVPLNTAGADAQGFFESFTASPSLQIVFYLLTMGATAAIVASGVAKGIEKACRWMMPVLFVCLAVLAVRSCTLPGAGEGLSFFLRPDFSKITPKVWILALGQVFFSLSVGAGAGITYGSYLNRKENIVRDAAVIAGFDTLAALIAGFAILPAVFSAGMNPQMGPGLLFVTLPKVFSGMPGGRVFCTLFFVLVLFASLTTTCLLYTSVGAHCLVAGHIFSTACKPGLPPRGIGFLRAVCQSVSIPVFAIGGMSAERVSEVMGAGAAGICVMSELMTCSDPGNRIREYKRRIGAVKEGYQ